MKAKHNFREVDINHKCLDCGSPLKKNLLERIPGALRCHTCTKLKSNSLNFNRARYKAKQQRLIATHK